MPLYLCNAKEGALSQEAKAGIAKDVTNIHCVHTGAPSEFVHVFFFEDAVSPPLGDHTVLLQGNIRAGRTAAQKQALVSEMQQSIEQHSGLGDADIHVLTQDVPASWVMEGGDVFPEPGEEAEWLKAHEKRKAAEAAS